MLDVCEWDRDDQAVAWDRDDHAVAWDRDDHAVAWDRDDRKVSSKETHHFGVKRGCSFKALLTTATRSSPS